MILAVYRGRVIRARKYTVFWSCTPTMSAPETTSVTPYSQALCCIAHCVTQTWWVLVFLLGQHWGSLPFFDPLFSDRMKGYLLGTCKLNIYIHLGFPVTGVATARVVIVLIPAAPPTLPFKHLNLLFLGSGKWMWTKGNLEPPKYRGPKGISKDRAAHSVLNKVF